MRVQSGTVRSNGRLSRFRRRHGSTLSLLGCFLISVASAGFVGLLDARQDSPLVLWISNGILLAYLLTAPRWRWPALLTVGILGEFLGGVLLDHAIGPNLIYAALNLAEVLISAHLLRRRSLELPDFTDSDFLLRFVAYGVLLSSVIGGLLYLPFALYWNPGHAREYMLSWTLGDGLGTAITTPACVAIFRRGLGSFRTVPRWWLYPALLLVINLAGFSQTRVPVLFLVYPLLVLMLLRLGMAWAGLGALYVAIVGSYFTVQGRGPLLLLHSLSSAAPLVMLQIYLISGMFMLYSISLVLDRKNEAESRLGEIVHIHTLVTENSRDLILLTDFHGGRGYVSPAAEKMGGWKPEEMLRARSLELVHPEDRAKVSAVLSSMKSGMEAAMVECRMRRRDNSYLWVEANLKMVADPVTGQPSGILNMMRDISERKAAEAELREAYRTLETLAITDPLTRLANRRHFDTCLTQEWRRGMRERAPLSLLLIDVDLFKAYNDTYGHLHGDNCLKQLAESAQNVVTRPGDLVARFGGEEFAIVLPGTSNSGAMALAEKLCEALRRLRMPHASNPEGCVTISVGCATTIPRLGQHAVTLIQQADDALYAAKNRGRNRVCSANADELKVRVWQAS
ncbi:MAG TPA: diguanylate cyclase [Terracidiphilus sp.]|nr:diguanylate cyclase [Terracidiphilus sp.]